jgi:hypothetical protein
VSHRWLVVLRTPGIDVSVKVQALRTYIMPSLLCGIEVWGPSSRTGLQLRDAAFKDAFAGMDQILHNALKSMQSKLTESGARRPHSRRRPVCFSMSC